MKISKILSISGFVALGLGAVAMLAAGCQSANAGMRPHAMAKSAKGGAELWTQNCLPCHNVRSPSAYSDADWEVVMQHMRVRANLSASDTEAIEKFLKSAN